MKQQAVVEQVVAPIETPVLTGIQRQGDVMVVPMRPGKVTGLVPVGVNGVVVAGGVAMRNDHTLFAPEGGVHFAPATDDLRRLGTVVVEEGKVAVIDHPEHGRMAFGPGSYALKCPVEQLDELRRVAD